jgi:hypothetical protein
MFDWATAVHEASFPHKAGLKLSSAPSFFAPRSRDTEDLSTNSCINIHQYKVSVQKSPGYWQSAVLGTSLIVLAGASPGTLLRGICLAVCRNGSSIWSFASGPSRRIEAFGIVGKIARSASV